MGRRERHPQDAILDAARAVVVERGVRAATIGAIARASQAPTGSIYHRFGSVQELLARLWVRAVKRSQRASLLPMTAEDPVECVVAAALGTYDFCLENPEDARLLGLFRREDFLDGDLPAELREALVALNDDALEQAKDLARRLFGRANRANVDLVLAAAIDLPYGLARQYLGGGTQAPAARRAAMALAVRAMLTQNPEQSGRSPTRV